MFCREFGNLAEIIALWSFPPVKGQKTRPNREKVVKSAKFGRQEMRKTRETT